MDSAKKKKRRGPDRLDRYVSMLKQKEKDATGSEPAASQPECAPGDDCPTARQCESSCSPPSSTGERSAPAVQTEPQLDEHPPSPALTYTTEDTPQRKFSGWVCSGFPEGEGSLWSCHEDGAHEFHGQFQSGLPSGTGFHVFPDGGKLSCSWTRGCPVGTGHP